MKLIIEDDEGRRTVVPFVRDELTIGRNDDNMVRLTEKNVSRKHGKLVRKDGHFYVEDLDSFTGIRVNGERVKGKRPVQEGDLIQISEFDLSLQSGPDDRTPTQGGGEGGLGDEDKGTSSKGAASVAAKDTEAPQRAAIDAAAEAQAELEARKLAETAIIRLSDLPASSPDSQPQELAPDQRPRLVCLSGTLRGKEFVLDRSPVRIGRGDENDLLIDHPSISRKHCRLSLENDAWKVMDAESRNGIRVNGEPYAAIGVRSGDTVELGHLKFAFVGPGQAFTLPPAQASLSSDGLDRPDRDRQDQPASSSRPLLLVLGALVVLASIGGFFALRRGNGSGAAEETAEGKDDAKAERKFALRAADEALTAHRYGEAVRNLQTAAKTGATAAELRALSQTQEEAKAEDAFHELESAMGGQDFDRARKLADTLVATPTWYGARAAEKLDEVKTGYVNLHVAAAALAKGKDNGACLSEAQLALAAAPANSDAQQLVDACKSGPGARTQPAPRPLAAAPAARVAAAAVARQPVQAPADRDDEARRLINEGNQKLIGLDYPAAIANFQGAIALKPTDPVLANAYRSMGITFTRQGNAEEGARYYKLYLPLCSNPNERQHLQKLLDDYEARRR